MAVLLERFPTTHDMILAYRKVKAEIWWMRTVPTLRKLAEYEEDLMANLKNLRQRITSGEFQADDSFLGDAYLLPKKLIPKDLLKSKNEKNRIHYCVLSDENAHNNNKWKGLDTRLMSVPSIDFQILGVLWCMGKGGDLDAERSSSCRANVLRRNYIPDEEAQFPDVEATLRGPINKQYPGVYKPYFQAYKNWRNQGLKKAREAVEGGQRVFALTLDLKRYFHQIDAKCLRKMFPAKDRVSEAFYISLECWQKLHGEEIENEAQVGIKRGIPVGLIASGLVANLLLRPVDKLIEDCLSPIYYGRYVDDFFIVLSLNGNYPDGESVLTEIQDLLNKGDDLAPSLESIQSNDGDEYFQFQYELWGESKFECQKGKQRLFCLEGKKGRDLLSILDSELKKHSSEWRMLPALGDDADKYLQDVLVANHDAVLEATSLRQTDDLSIRRMGIAVSLRKLESIERFELSSKSWKSHRENFYKVATTHVCTPEGLCDFWPNLPRLFGLTFANSDWKAANRILTQIIKSHGAYKAVLPAQGSQVLVEWLCESIDDEFARALKKPPSGAEARRFVRRFQSAFNVKLETKEATENYIELFSKRDLDRIGHRLRGRKGDEADSFTTEIEQLDLFFSKRKSKLPATSSHLLFPTRPLGEIEICRHNQDAAVSIDIMRKCLFVLRGQTKWKDLPSNNEKNEKPPPHINLQSIQTGKTVRVAISNFKTEESSWTARVRQKPDLSLVRLRQIFALADQFLRDLSDSPWKERPLYFCLPELSVPPEWVYQIAAYFSQFEVSLIAGVEYEPSSKGTKYLKNSAYLFLRNRTLGYPTTYLLRQEKTQSAPGEAHDLWKEGHYKLTGPNPDELPVYVHGDFRFSVVLCSELTDAKIHHHFRGYVDAIFCLEWNPDVETFSSLVESTAQTIHAFVIQVNNRKYGDSRLRSPAKQRYNRDIVRIKGGDHNYYVVGELPIEALRSFQRKANSDLGNDALFKALPSGYDPLKFERLHKPVEEKTEDS